MAMDKYWATLDGEELAGEVVRHFREYWNRLENDGTLAVYRAALRTYYGRDATGGYASSHFVSFGGEVGERVEIRVDHFRSLVTRLHSMATAERPHFELTATNDTSAGYASVSVGKQVLTAKMDDGVEDVCKAAAEVAQLCDRAYVHMPWDVTKGELVTATVPDAEGEAPQDIRTGDLCVEMLMPTDVAVDLDAPPREQCQWYVIRKPYQRWDLAARYPEHAEAIIGTQSALQSQTLFDGSATERRTSDSDWIDTLIMYHAPTPSVPGGRYAHVVGEDIVLRLDTLSTPTPPIEEMRPIQMHDSAGGYSDAWGLMAMQRAYDSTISSAVTQVDAVPLPTLIVADDQDADVRKVAKGLRALDYSSNDGRTPPPAWLGPPPISESLVQLRGLLKEDMETTSGVNSIARGQPSENAKSGAHAALFHTMAVQAASGLVSAYGSLLRRVMTRIIETYRTHASEPLTIQLAGADDASLVKQFRGTDLDGIAAVKVELGSAATRSFAQRLEMANQMIERFPGQVSVEQWFRFIQTGRYEPMYKHQSGEARAISAENERLSRGEPVKMFVLDHHLEHMKEHACLLHSPAVRFDDALSGAVLAHIQEHMTTVQGAMSDPMLYETLAATGMRLPQPIPMGGPMPDAGPMPPSAAGDEPPTSDPVPGPTGATAEQAPADMPRLPTDPTTGERAQVPAGVM